jgi:hypothetical protein
LIFRFIHGYERYYSLCFSFLMREPCCADGTVRKTHPPSKYPPCSMRAPNPGPRKQKEYTHSLQRPSKGNQGVYRVCNKYDNIGIHRPLTIKPSRREVKRAPHKSVEGLDRARIAQGYRYTLFAIFDLFFAAWLFPRMIRDVQGGHNFGVRSKKVRLNDRNQPPRPSG